jgi:hypothetical protein
MQPWVSRTSSCTNEQAKNRISAGRLYELSEGAGRACHFLFEGLAETDVKARKPKRSKDGQQR